MTQRTRSTSEAPTRRGRIAVSWVALSLVAAVATAPVTSAADPEPLPMLPASAASAAIPLSELDPEVAAPYSGVARVDLQSTCSGVLVDPGQDPERAIVNQPAYLITNGHCIGFLGPNEVRLDQPGFGSVTFGWEGGPTERTVAVKAIPYATMKGTDVAIVELDATLGELMDAGIHPFPLLAGHGATGTTVVVVGAPVSLDGSARRLLASTCTTGERPRILEYRWSWTQALSADCPDIRPGSSGSPILDPVRGGLIGVINTTTQGSENVSDCSMGRPCEVLDDGRRHVSRPDTAYGASVEALDQCFDGSGAYLGPGGECPLDPGVGLEIEGVAMATNPDLPSPDGRPPVATWAAGLSSPDQALTHYAVQVGRVGAIDCGSVAGYGAPVALADVPRYDEPLPTEEGHHELCIIAGPGPVIDETWQQPRFASVSTVWIDRTPPIVPIQVYTIEDPDGWRVEPVFVVPELTWYVWKMGPPQTTDCAEAAGYTTYRRVPAMLPKDEAPTRLCIIGFDDANNPTEPYQRDFAS